MVTYVLHGGTSKSQHELHPLPVLPTYAKRVMNNILNKCTPKISQNVGHMLAVYAE